MQTTTTVTVPGRDAPVQFLKPTKRMQARLMKLAVAFWKERIGDNLYLARIEEDEIAKRLSMIDQTGLTSRQWAHYLAIQEEGQFAALDEALAGYGEAERDEIIELMPADLIQGTIAQLWDITLSKAEVPAEVDPANPQQPDCMPTTTNPAP